MSQEVGIVMKSYSAGYFPSNYLYNPFPLGMFVLLVQTER